MDKINNEITLNFRNKHKIRIYNTLKNHSKLTNLFPVQSFLNDKMRKFFMILIYNA